MADIVEVLNSSTYELVSEKQKAEYRRVFLVAACCMREVQDRQRGRGVIFENDAKSTSAKDVNIKAIPPRERLLALSSSQILIQAGSSTRAYRTTRIFCAAPL